MKKFLQFSMFLFLGFSAIGNAQNNSSNGTVNTSVPPFSLPPGNIEAFRFRPGLITQLDAGAGFDFTTGSQWSSLGRLSSVNQTLYGLRVQRAGKGLVFGYSGLPQGTSLTPTAGDYPFIQWIGNSAAGVGAGDLRFETAPDPTNTVSNLVFTLRSNGTALLGTTPNSSVFPKLEINSVDIEGLSVKTINSGTTASFTNDGGTPSQKFGAVAFGVRSTASSIGGNFGFSGNVFGGIRNDGVNISVSSSLNNASNCGYRAFINADNGLLSTNYGIVVNVSGSNAAGSINNGIFASATGINALAGNFAGGVACTTLSVTSDKSLKTNIKKEERVLEILGKMNPVTYNYIPQKENMRLNLSEKLQHGFIAQELAEVMPELVQDIVYPIFDDKNEQVGTRTLKSVNYIGLISVLTASVKELSEEVKQLKSEKQNTQKTFVVTQTEAKQFTNNELGNIKEKAFFLAQNTPNPFSGSTEIAYSLPVNEKNASILILNLNGQTIKEYILNANEGTITINAGMLQKGMYLYSLISNGQEITTKKMVVN